MRVVSVLAIALLLSGCTWVRHELAVPAPPASPAAKPIESKPPRRPLPRVAPEPQSQATTPTPPPAAPPPDYNARCRDMAANRAGDARQLGASAADQAKVQNDTFRDCMAQSVKPTQ